MTVHVLLFWILVLQNMVHAQAYAYLSLGGILRASVAGILKLTAIQASADRSDGFKYNTIHRSI